jgi:predicted secreted protein
MTIAFGIALYFMIWWITLFAVLPFGVHTQGDAGDVTPGTPESAPARPRLLRVFLINTVVASLTFAFVWYAMQSDWFGAGSLPPPAPGVTN